jgi:hypothetical protein
MFVTVISSPFFFHTGGEYLNTFLIRLLQYLKCCDGICCIYKKIGSRLNVIEVCCEFTPSLLILGEFPATTESQSLSGRDYEN